MQDHNENFFLCAFNRYGLKMTLQ